MYLTNEIQFSVGCECIAYLTHFVYLNVGTLWILTAAPKIDTFELKKYLATILADKIGYKEESDFEQSSRDIQGK